VEQLVGEVTEHECSAVAPDVAALLEDTERPATRATDAMTGMLLIDEVCNPTDLPPARVDSSGRHLEGLRKDFETLIHHTLPLCFAFNMRHVASLFDELGADAQVALRKLAEVDGIDFDDPGCTQFPWVAKSPADSDQVLEAIAKVGADSSRRGLAFMPTEQLNRGYDHYLVLPKNGGGRVVLAFQEKDWLVDTFNSRGDPVMHHVEREARRGRQYFTQDRVHWGRASAERGPSPNTFRQRLQARMASA
jgi:hypothetical protein